MTFEAAENEPIFNGRSAYAASWTRRSSWSTPPSASCRIRTTSAIDSRHGSSLEWCSYGPMKTTGRSPAGMCSLSRYRSSSTDGIRRPRMPISFAIAPVLPEPANSTSTSSSPPTASRMIARASSRRRVVCRPVPLDSVCVLA